MTDRSETYFAPQLVIPHGVRDADFYRDGLGAVELRRWSNEDGTIHVAELAIDGAIFFLHEAGVGASPPSELGSITATVGLFVSEVDALIERAVAAGAELRSSARDYDYGYRQGEIIDPYGHRWLIQKQIGS